MEVVTTRLEARLGLEVERPGGGLLILRAGWELGPHEVFLAARPHLAPREVLEVARALGLPVPPAEPAATLDPTTPAMQKGSNGR